MYSFVYTDTTVEAAVAVASLSSRKVRFLWVCFSGGAEMLETGMEREREILSFV